MDITYINHWFNFSYKNSSDSIEDICSYFVKNIEPKLKIKNAPSFSTGIYLATSDAGLNSSVNFWKSALEMGPGFVFPQTFPWTLSNFPSGYFARELKIHGPNYTIVGTGEALLTCLDHALFDLVTKEVDNAIIIGIDFGLNENEEPQFGGIILSKNKSQIQLNRTDNIDISFNVKNVRPSEVIRKICLSINANEDFIFGTNEEGIYYLSVSI